MNELMAFELIEPFWFDRLHAQLALIAAAIGRWAGDSNVTPEDFDLETDSDNHQEVGPVQAEQLIRSRIGGHGNR